MLSEQAVRADERVFLVVVDESPEMRNALRYACRRAKRTGGRVAMLYVMDPPEGQQWGAVVDLMRQEARQQAEDVVAKHADAAATLTGQPPTIHIREGKSRDELLKLVDRGSLDLGSGAGQRVERRGAGPAGHGLHRQARQPAPDPAHHRSRRAHRGRDRRNLIELCANFRVVLSKVPSE